MIENALMKLDDSCRELNLSGLDLTSLPHVEHMVLLTSLDLSANQLSELPDLSSLQCLRHIKLDDNRLTSLEQLKDIPSLIRVTATNNGERSLPHLSLFFARVLTPGKNEVSFAPQYSVCKKATNL